MMRPSDRLPGTVRWVLLGALASTALLSTACVAVGGSRQTQAVQPTVGQQLIDLKKALDCGAITQKEYDCQKSKVLGS